MKKLEKGKGRGERRDWVYFLFLLPSLLGVVLFYSLPFLMSLYYALVNNMAQKKWNGLGNFRDLFANDLFTQAAGNTLRFIVVSVPLGIVLALLIVLAMQKWRRGKGLALLLLLIPLILPSGTTISFWKAIFDTNGLLNRVRFAFGLPVVNWANGGWSFAIIVFIFLWKNISYNVVLFWSGINWIPKTYYEQCQMEGGGAWAQFKYITWVYLAPTTFVVLLMSLVNSFKVFKEIYMLYGSYPSSAIYMLQHYMNNQFAAMNMQKLASAAYLMFLVLGVALLVIFRLQKRVADSNS